MKIKTRIIGIFLLGITLLFGVSFYSTQEINSANREYSAQESIIAHSSAWTSNMDVEFTDKLYVYDPEYGTGENIEYWNYSSEDPFGTGDLQNPLHKAFAAKDGGLVSDLLSSVFLSPIETEQLTFAVAYDNRGLQLFCESSLYVIGVDPCSEAASPDYFLNFAAFVADKHFGLPSPGFASPHLPIRSPLVLYRSHPPLPTPPLPPAPNHLPSPESL